MTATLNVGLNVGDVETHSPRRVAQVLSAMGLSIVEFRTLRSDTERTAVAKIHRPLSPQEGHALAVVLRQEAIAQYVTRTDGSGSGKAFGPQSGRWVFNPKFFILIDGTRLADAPWPWDVEKTAVSYRARNTHTKALGPERSDFDTAKADADRLTLEGATTAKVDYSQERDSERQS